MSRKLNPVQELAQTLFAARERRKISQRQLALDIGVSNTMVSLWESGRGFPGYERISLLAEELGIEESALQSLIILAKAWRKEQMRKARQEAAA